MDGLREQPGDDPPFAVPERAFATIGKDFLDGLAGGGLDLRIRIEERQTEARREAAADLALSGPHQTDQDNGSARHEPTGFCRFPVRLCGVDLHPDSHCSFSPPADRVLAYRATWSSIGAGP